MGIKFLQSSIVVLSVDMVPFVEFFLKNFQLVCDLILY